MTHQDLVAHLQGLGFALEGATAGSPPASYVVIRGFPVQTGSHKGQALDIAIQASTAVPYVLPPAIHVRPALVTMGVASSQPSPLGPEWQYLSRVLRVPPSPSSVLAHIHSVLNEL